MVGASNGGNNGTSKRKQMMRQRKRDEVPSVGIVTRRSASRCSISKQNKNGLNGGRRIGLNGPVNKYASRRTSFFKCNRPQKAPNQKATTRCHEALWDKCQRLFRTGDIISITDTDDGLRYFAQIRALLSNQLGERFAALTWLVPTESAKEAHEFDAEQFNHILSDSAMYPLDVCTFVEHAPMLPCYHREWKPRSLVEKRMQEELKDRVRSINTISTKLIAYDEKVPLQSGSQKNN